MIVRPRPLDRTFRIQAGEHREKRNRRTRAPDTSSTRYFHPLIRCEMVGTHK
jgi:hypothetical protein